MTATQIPLVYVESDLEDGQTLQEWRRARDTATRSHRRGLLRRNKR